MSGTEISTRPLRVVYVWDADYPWDVRTEKTCLALTQAGHDVHIVARNRKWSPLTERLPEGTVHRMPPWRWLGQRVDGVLGFPAFFNPRWRRLLTRVVREVHADVIIARDLPLCPTAIQVGRKANAPVILDMAENYPAMMHAIWETGRNRPIDSLVRNPKMVERVERYCVHHADHIVVVVEESRDRLLRLGVPASKITVISNTPPRERAEWQVRPARSAPAGGLDVIYMGNIEVARGILESIEAVALLRAAGHRVRLRLIGKGRDDALMRERARALGLGSDAVEFLGYIASHREALDLVAAADVGLMPHQKCEAWDTTIPNKLFDYMAAELPVLSSDAEPCRRILAETGAGIVFQSGNAQDVARQLERLLALEARAAMGHAGKRAVLGRYHWEHDAALFRGVVERAASRPNVQKSDIE